MFGTVPTSLMRVLTEREGLPPLASEPAWRARWQWWTERPTAPQAASAPVRREPSGRELSRYELSRCEACPQPGA